MMPGQVLVYEPAKRPYTIEKTKSGASDMENPQMRKTPIVDPTVDTRMQVVTSHLSMMAPITTQPTTEATLKRMTVSACKLVDAPITPA